MIEPCAKGSPVIDAKFCQGLCAAMQALYFPCGWLECQAWWWRGCERIDSSVTLWAEFEDGGAFVAKVGLRASGAGDGYI